ncbi:hypothetical protein AEAC466_10070 [Asticcacaulis sp. AC466]|uniref:glycoside hydrolase family 43 protein n=1 Tax=Asticcacaulis sp. AC466 TaxID=1282362 RepID=UPI0003C412C3|nr:glycoside hydrolase family 43 protein [Asticcacaulis sp. AC466]ESQ84082.1 hypothetical protein AEAC466_10070 [Asticcacaulis sp. AC466]
MFRFVFTVLTSLALAAGSVQAAVPVLDVDFPDPLVLPVDGGLVAYATNGKSGGKRLNIQFSRSSDGVHWSAPVDAMPELPRWARSSAPDVWAPEVMKIGDTYVMYFSARHKTRMRPDGLTLCVGAAVSKVPEGPFVPETKPLTCGGELGAIDASPFRDGDDLWLYVKTDGNCCGVPISIIAQRLTADGQHLAGAPALVEGVTNDKPWEGGVVEGEQMIKHDGRYYMVYAANDYGSDAYATGYAVCQGPVGRCRDADENPILKSAPGLVGPGHQSVFDFRGRTWIAYHAWRYDGDPRKRYRALYISPLDWVDGKPVIAP